MKYYRWRDLPGNVRAGLARSIRCGTVEGSVGMRTHRFPFFSVLFGALACVLATSRLVEGPVLGLATGALVFYSIGGVLLVRAGRRLFSSRVPGVVLTCRTRFVIPPPGLPVRMEGREEKLVGFEPTAELGALHRAAPTSEPEPEWVASIARNEIPARGVSSPLSFLVTPVLGLGAGLLLALLVGIHAARLREDALWQRTLPSRGAPDGARTALRFFELRFWNDHGTAFAEEVTPDDEDHWDDRTYLRWHDRVREGGFGRFAYDFTAGAEHFSVALKRLDQKRFEDALEKGTPGAVRDYLGVRREYEIDPPPREAQALEAIRELYYAAAESYERDARASGTGVTEQGLDAVVALLRFLGEENRSRVGLTFDSRTDLEGDELDQALRQVTGSKVVPVGPSFTAEKNRARVSQASRHIASAFHEVFKGYVGVEQGLSELPRLAVSYEVRGQDGWYGLKSEDELPDEERTLWVSIAMEFDIRLEVPGGLVFPSQLQAVPAPDFSVASNRDGSTNQRLVYDQMADTAFGDLSMRLVETYGLVSPAREETAAGVMQASPEDATPVPPPPSFPRFGELTPGSWIVLSGTRVTRQESGPVEDTLAHRLEVEESEDASVAVALTTSVNGAEEEWGSFTFPAAAMTNADDHLSRIAGGTSAATGPPLRTIEQRKIGERTYTCERIEYPVENDHGTLRVTLWISADGPCFGLLAQQTVWEPKGGARAPTTVELDSPPMESGT